MSTQKRPEQQVQVVECSEETKTVGTADLRLNPQRLSVETELTQRGKRDEESGDVVDSGPPSPQTPSQEVSTRTGSSGLV